MNNDRGNGRTSGDKSSNQPNQDQLNFSSEEIAERAYQIYEREGRADGKDMDHWLQAERELREERAQEQNRSVSQQSAGSFNRSPRPDEAPRSARRHQTSVAQ